MTYIRVRVITSEGNTAESNVQPLTVRVGEDSGTSQKADEISNVINMDAPSDSESDSGDAEKTKKPKKKVQEIDSIAVEETRSTMSDYLDGAATIDPTTSGDFSEVVINKEVSEKIAEQQEAIKEAKESKTPGARWTEISALNPKDDELQRIFADNPFAPFAIPLSLGVVFAGGLEKLLSFRRQL